MTTVLNERGITKELARSPCRLRARCTSGHIGIEIARQRGRFTVFAPVDAPTRISDKLANAGDRSEADAKASALLALTA